MWSAVISILCFDINCTSYLRTSFVLNILDPSTSRTFSMRNSVESMDVEPVFGGLDREETAIDQAAVFLEDAVKYRSIHHKIDKRSLRIYRIYYSRLVRWGLKFVIIVDLGLAFFEKPSSLTISSDPRFCGPRPEAPCGVLEFIEILCLLCFVFDVVIKSHFLGRRQLIKNRWMLAYMSVLVISFVDVFVSLSFGCKEVVRIRRILRPFFLLQNSSLMKKLLRAIKRTLPEIMSVLFLLFLHLFFFTMFGMFLFPRENVLENSNNETQTLIQECRKNTSDSGAICEGAKFFKNLPVSMRSLLVLLTTANNPDVMMPAYMKNRFYAIYFLLFTSIGLYCFLNLLTAIVYNQFRGYLMKSLQSSLFRRRLGVRAAFEVLCHLSIPDNDAIFQPTNFVTKENVRQVIDKAKLAKRKKQLLKEALNSAANARYDAKEFQDLFDVLEKRARQRHRPPMSFVGNRCLRRFQIVVSHTVFDYFGDFMAGVNVIIVSAMLDIHYDSSVRSSHSALSVVNFFFVLYYLFEQGAKLWALGWQRYISFKGNMYCGVVTVFLAMVETIIIIIHGTPFDNKDNYKIHSLDDLLSVANLIRIVNMLIIFRLLRIIPNIKALSLIAETLLNLLRNLTPFAGLIVAIYYIFAILGMMLFANVTDPNTRCAVNKNSTTTPCTELDFDLLQYYANNFNDFAASLVLLWDIMVVNNWHVFLKAYAKLVSSWAQLYFLAWYLVSVIISINLFVALILEAFVNQWERRQQKRRQTMNTQTQDDHDPRFHQLFSSGLDEPLERDVLAELKSHEHLNFRNPEII